MFNPGDTVKLKSGGPIMTVDWIDGQYAHCDWFENTGSNKKHQHGRFNIASLKPHDPTKGGDSGGAFLFSIG